MLSHHGRIFDGDNKPLVGPQTLTFRVYDAADDTGVVLWSETVDVAVSNGYYSTILGQTVAIPDTVFDGSTRFLGVTVGDETVTEEMTPRLEVTSVAYAIKAGVAENATGALTPESISLAGGSTTLNSDGSIHAGAATIATDGTITLGAATVNVDGSIDVGNTTIGADGAITVNNAAVIAADGTVDSGSIGGTTLDSLEAAGCMTGQLPQFDAASGWGCFSPAAGTVYSAGAGLNIDASSVFSVDSMLVQTRVTSTCVAGEAIQTINEDGSVICETDDDTTYLAGTGLALDGATNTFNVDQTQIEAWANGVDNDTTYTAGAGIDISAGVVSLIDTVDDDTTYTAGTGINIAGGVVSLVDTTDNDTTYSNGVGLDLAAGVFSVNQSQVEAWADGVDDDTMYSAGAGLALDAGNQFSVDATQTQRRVTGSCVVGAAIRTINEDGTVVCDAPGEIWLRGAQITTGATIDSMAFEGGAVIAIDGGYGAGVKDLLVDGTTFFLPSGEYEYNNITVINGGVLTVDHWSGATGGALTLRIRDTLTVDATSSIDVSERGYRGGRAYPSAYNGVNQGAVGVPGESYRGIGRRQDPCVAFFGGGGGGSYDTGNYGAAGGGGSYGSAGQSVGTTPAGGCSGQGGSVYGDADITKLHFGSGGGSGGTDEDHTGRGGHGGAGGGALLVEAGAVDIAGALRANGAQGGNATSSDNGGGGGGAGGSLVLRARTGQLQASGVLQASGGSGGNGLGGFANRNGGTGGNGRVRIDGGSLTVAGTVTPPAGVVISDATAIRGDQTYGQLTTDVISFTDATHRFMMVDLHMDRDADTFVKVEFCSAATAADTLVETCFAPVSTSGHIDATAGDRFGRLRLTVTDRSDDRVFALDSVRVVHGL